jgi:predicted RNase H-like HicB family nuclease
MTNRFLYEAELQPNELGGYSVTFPQLSDAFTYGKDLNEAVLRASEVLELVIAEYLDEGISLPEPVFEGHADDVLRIGISVEVTPDLIARTRCVTTSEAATMLNLSRGRVSHMLDAGILQALPFGNERLVTIASINERKANPRKAGRPGKDAMAV